LTAEGEFALVRQHLEAALVGTSDWVGDHDIYAMLADTAALQGDLEALQRYAALAEQSAERYGHRLFQAIAQRAQGVAHRLAGEYGPAGVRLTKALGTFDELGARWQVGRTHVELGKLAQDQGDRAAAIEHYKQALTQFESQGALPDLARTQAALAELG
jgi:tetratricopeptide (TPR) repeat protein